MLTHLAALLLALATVLSNERVAVFDGSDGAPREHDAVVDPSTRTARFVPQGQPIQAATRSIVIDLLKPPVGPLPNPDGLRDAFDRPGIEKLLENDRVTVWRYAWPPGKRTRFA